MKLTPLLFKADMVRALLFGNKTQTRRVIKPQPAWNNITDYIMGHAIMGENGKPITSPYGLAGDRIWVKETWRTLAKYNHLKPRELPDDAMINFKAGFSGIENSDFNNLANKWRSPLFLQQRFSRITLEITNVRVERLNECSEADAIAEGIDSKDGQWRHYLKVNKFGASPVHSYQTLWESINGVGSWDKNPWVWVIEFKVVKK
jgi:hypothetical protein